MQAVGYARISIEDQSQNSLPGQQERINAYCRQNKLQLLKIFTDNGQSAFNFQRKEWKEVEVFLKKNKEVKYLVVDSMDRFSRANLVDALQKMQELQQRLGVKILTVTDPVNLDIEDFGTDLRRIMELMFSNYELKRIRKRTSDGMYQAMSGGRWVNKAPTGYINRRDPEGRPVIVIDEEKAYLVRLVFRCFLNGMDLEEIRKQAKANGLKLSGNSSIRRMLSNPLYAGMIQLPARGAQPGTIVKGIHAPIVSELDFWQVQDRLNKKTRATQKNEQVWLKGSLHCECGLLLSTDKSKGKSGKYYSYYLCRKHRKNLSAVKLHKQMEEVLSCLSIPNESLQRIQGHIEALISERVNNKSGDMMRAAMNLQKVQDRILATQERYLLQPDISEKIYKKVMAEMKADEMRLQEQVADLGQSGKDYYSMMHELLPKLSNIPVFFQDLPLYKKTAFLILLFGKRLYYKEGIFRTPYLHPLFISNELLLKEKGLIIKDQSNNDNGITPGSSPYGSWLELLTDLWQVFAA